jgi:hypothetical protein
MQKLQDRSSHVSHALTKESNRFRLIRLTAKASRMAWTRDKLQSENINGILKVIGKGGKG